MWDEFPAFRLQARKRYTRYSGGMGQRPAARYTALLGKNRPGLYHSGAMRVLFITATRIGDAVLSTGVLSDLVARHPDARFTIAAGPAAAPLFEAMPRL